MRAHTWILLALLFLGSAGVLGADEVPEAPETWRFVRDGVERVVDVSAMPPFVRQALVERLETEGFVRVERRAGTRDLRTDARTLVRHGGHFPSGAHGHPETLADLAPEVAATLRALAAAAPLDPAAGRALRLAERLEAPCAVRAGAAPIRGVVLGARVVAVAGGWRVLHVHTGSVASVLGLRVGARILGVGTLPATADTLRAWQDPHPGEGQRTLRVLRTDGLVETWTLRCDPGPLPPRRRSPHSRQGS